MMELRHIRYFLMVADERSFTKAACRLGIGQPPLSVQIRDLESEIGVPLFTRSGKGIDLTQSGKVFYDAIHPVIGLTRHAVNLTRESAAGTSGKLRIGTTGTTAIHALTQDYISLFRERYPDVALQITEENSSTLLHMIKHNQLDVAFTRSHDCRDPAINLHVLQQEKMVLAVPGKHYVPEWKNGIDLRLLDKALFISTPVSEEGNLTRILYDCCLQAGFEPRLGQPAPHIMSILSLVSVGAGVALLPESSSGISFRNVSFITVVSPQPVCYLSLAWHSVALSPQAENFINMRIA